jgi:hypothetical protein
MIIKEIQKDILFIKNHTLQPSWFKITKVFVLLGIVISLFLVLGFTKTIIWFSIFLLLGLIVHLIYRIKTHNYTKSWMDFEVKEVEGKRIYGRIGFLYYSLVIIMILLSTIALVLIN